MKRIKFKHGQANTSTPTQRNLNTHPHTDTHTHTRTHCQPPRLPKTKNPKKYSKVCKVVACKKFARIAKVNKKLTEKAAKLNKKV